MTVPADHALIVEDDEALAQALAKIVHSLGHTSRRVRTLAELRAAIAPSPSGGGATYTYALLDMQIPPYDGQDPDVGCGETALELLRQMNPSRTPRGKHRFQILVITAYSRDPSFVTRMIVQMEADDFLAKPLGETGEVVRDRVRAALRRAELGENQSEAKGPSGAGERSPESAVPIVARVVFDAPRRKRQCGFTVNGKRRWLQDSKFIPFLSLGAARLLGSGAESGWRSREVLKMGHAPEVPSRIGEQFRGLVPEGFVVVEGDGEGNFRLNPGVEVAPVDWEALEGHPSEEVRRVAREMRGKIPRTIAR